MLPRIVKMDDELNGFNPMEDDYNSTFNSYNYEGSGIQRRDKEFVPRLHISLVPRNLDDETFKELFSKCGEIERCYLYSMAQKNFKVGKITFKSLASNLKAIEMYHCREPYQMNVSLDRRDNTRQSRAPHRPESANDFNMPTARRAPDESNSYSRDRRNGQRTPQSSATRFRQETDRQPDGGHSTCAVCSNKGASKCRNCGIVYCTLDCQKADWTNHKEVCGIKPLRKVNSNEASASPEDNSSHHGRNQRDSSEQQRHRSQRGDVARHRNPVRVERSYPRNRSRSLSAHTGFGDNRASGTPRPSIDHTPDTGPCDSSTAERKLENKQPNDLNQLDSAQRKQTVVSNSSSNASLTRNIPDQPTSSIKAKSDVDIQSKGLSVVDLGEANVADLPSEVTVTYIENPHSFYVRPHAEDHIPAVLEKMWKTTTVDKNVQVNDLVAAKYREDNEWYRAKVLSINSDSSCRVYFIDYGNVGPIVLHEIFLLPSELAKIPGQALHCCLANVEPTNGIKWTKEEVEEFQILVADNILTMKRVKRIDDVHWVLLTDDSRKDIGQLMVSTNNAKLLLPIKSHTMDEWKCGSDIITSVTVADHPGHYRVLDVSSGIVDHLKSLHDVCSQSSSSELDKLSVGAVVAAKECVEEMWHRAVILEILRDGWLVQYLDFGNCEKVKEVKLLPEEFKMFPAAAVLLSAVSYAFEESDKEINAYDSLTLKAIKCDNEIKLVSFSDNKYHLYAASSVWFEIKGRLTKKTNKDSGRQHNNFNNNAVECDSINTSRESPAGKSKLKEEASKVPEAESELKKIASKVPKAELELKEMAIKVETVESNLKDSPSKRSPAKPDLKDALNFQLPAVKFPGPEETVAIIPIVCTTEEVYVQISSPENVEISTTIFETLGNFCEESGKLLVELPSVSQFLCSKSIEDDQWYRCEVLEVNSPDSIEVRYIDYGNKETLNLDRFTEMPNHYHQFPPIAIRIALADVDMTSEVCNILTNTEADWQMSVVNSRSHPVEVILSTSTGTLLKEMVAKAVQANGAKPQMRSESGTYQTEDVKDKFGGSNRELKLESDTCKVYKSDVDGKAPSVKSSVKSSGSTCSLSSLSGRVEKLEINDFKFDDADLITLPVGKTVDVTFITVTAPLAMYCWYGNNKLIEEQLSALTERISNVMKMENQVPYIPRRGDLCVARFSSDQKWYRATCLSVGQIVCNVLYVDFGNIEKVLCSGIGPMRKEFMELPIQGVWCVIKGIPENVNFGPDKCKAFQELVPQNQVCNVKVVDYDEKGGFHTIQIASIEPALKKLQLLGD